MKRVVFDEHKKHKDCKGHLVAIEDENHDTKFQVSICSSNASTETIELQKKLFGTRCDDSFAVMMHNIALELMGQGAHEGAGRLLQAAIALPNISTEKQIMAIYDLAYSLESQGRYLSAAVECTKAINLESSMVYISNIFTEKSLIASCRRLASLLERVGYTTAASEYLERAVEPRLMNPGDQINSECHLVECYLKSGMFDLAQKQVKETRSALSKFLRMSNSGLSKETSALLESHLHLLEGLRKCKNVPEKNRRGDKDFKAAFTRLNGLASRPLGLAFRVQYYLQDFKKAFKEVQQFQDGQARALNDLIAKVCFKLATEPDVDMTTRGNHMRDALECAIRFHGPLHPVTEEYRVKIIELCKQNKSLFVSQFGTPALGLVESLYRKENATLADYDVRRVEYKVFKMLLHVERVDLSMDDAIPELKEIVANIRETFLPLIIDRRGPESIQVKMTETVLLRHVTCITGHQTVEGMKQKEREDSVPFFQAAVETWFETGFQDSMMLAQAYMVLASAIAETKGLTFPKVAEYYEKALRIYSLQTPKKQAYPSLAELFCRLSLVTLYCITGSVDHAERITQALPSHTADNTQSGFYLHAALIACMRFCLAFSKSNNLQQSEKLLKECISILKKLEKHGYNTASLNSEVGAPLDTQSLVSPATLHATVCLSCANVKLNRSATDDEVTQLVKQGISALERGSQMEAESEFDKVARGKLLAQLQHLARQLSK